VLSNVMGYFDGRRREIFYVARRFDANTQRDRSDEAGRFLWRAIVDGGAYGLEGPFLTSRYVDMRYHADWQFRFAVPESGGPRPPGLVFAGSRYLSNRGTDDWFLGKYMSIRDMPDLNGATEYSVWLDGARRSADGSSTPSFMFYLMVWTDGPDGPVLMWAVVDMADWASKTHVKAVGDCGLATPFPGVIHFDRKESAAGVSFVRFPMSELKIVKEWTT
jgi:hypothetical protein